MVLPPRVLLRRVLLRSLLERALESMESSLHRPECSTEAALLVLSLHRPECSTEAALLVPSLVNGRKRMRERLVNRESLKLL